MDEIRPFKPAKRARYPTGEFTISVQHRRHLKMKWKTPYEPKPGDTSIIKEFALFPRKCDDGSTRWLEWVISQYRFGGQPGPFWFRDFSKPINVCEEKKNEFKV